MPEPNDSDSQGEQQTNMNDMDLLNINVQSIDDTNDSDSDIQIADNNVKRKLRTFNNNNNCSKVIVGIWEIVQFRDSTPTIYINTLTMEQTDIKPIEISQLEAKPELFVIDFYRKFRRIPLFDEMPYYVQNRLDYMANFKRYNWNKVAQNEYLNDKIISYLSNIIKQKHPLVSGLFDTVELQKFAVAHKIIDQGLSIIHCEPSLHFILAENMNRDGIARIWDGIGIDNDNVRCQMAKMFALDNNKTLKYRYEKNAKQIDGFECGDLCFAKAIELLSGNKPSNIVFANPAVLRLHTSTILISQTATSYPKSSTNTIQYTPIKNVSLHVLSCCWLPISYAPVIRCNGKCRELYHKICKGLDVINDCNDFVCENCN
eukprot:476684_1